MNFEALTGTPATGWPASVSRRPEICAVSGAGVGVTDRRGSRTFTCRTTKARERAKKRYSQFEAA